MKEREDGSKYFLNNPTEYDNPKTFDKNKKGVLRLKNGFYLDKNTGNVARYNLNNGKLMGVYVDPEFKKDNKTTKCDEFEPVSE